MISEEKQPTISYNQITRVRARDLPRHFAQTLVPPPIKRNPPMPCKIETVVKERFPNEKAGKVGIFKTMWDVEKFPRFPSFSFGKRSLTGLSLMMTFCGHLSC